MQKIFNLCLLLFTISLSALFAQNSGWVKNDTVTNEKLNSVTYSNHSYWIVGDNGTILKDYKPLNAYVSDNLNKIKFSDDGWGLIAGDKGTVVYVEKSGNLNLINSNTTENLKDIAFTDHDSSVVIVGDNGTIIKSRTDSIRFQIISDSKDYNLNSVSFDVNGTGWAVGTNGTVLKSVNSGNTWQKVSINTDRNLNNVNVFDSKNLWISGDGGFIISSTDGGGNWQNSSSNINNNINGEFFPSMRYESVFKDNSITKTMYTHDYSLTSNSTGTLFFSEVDQGIKYIDEQGNVDDYAPKGSEIYYADMKFNKGDTLFSVRDVRAIFYYPQKGSTPQVWAVLQNTNLFLHTFDFDAKQNIWAGGNISSIFCITPSKKVSSFPFKPNIKRIKIRDNLLYALTSTSDSVDTIWQAKIFPNDSIGVPNFYFTLHKNGDSTKSIIYDFEVDKNNKLIICSNKPDILDLVNTDNSLESIFPLLSSSLKTHDLDFAYLAYGDKSKSNLYLSYYYKHYDGYNIDSRGDIIEIIEKPLVQLQGWLVGKNGTIIHKAENDSVWFSQETPTDLNINSICFMNDTSGIAVGDSGLILTTNRAGNVTGTTDYSKNAVVSDYNLEQNYPNPFNPSTTIQYQISKPGEVSLSVYNLLGQKVVALVDKLQSVGSHKITFDASKLSSGIYFYSLNVKPSDGTTGFRNVKKMVLLK